MRYQMKILYWFFFLIFLYMPMHVPVQLCKLTRWSYARSACMCPGSTFTLRGICTSCITIYLISSVTYNISDKDSSRLNLAVWHISTHVRTLAHVRNSYWCRLKRWKLGIEMHVERIGDERIGVMWFGNQVVSDWIKFDLACTNYVLTNVRTCLNIYFVARTVHLISCLIPHLFLANTVVEFLNYCTKISENN